VAAGSVLRFNYRNHSETVYCLAGRATLTDINNNRELRVRPRTLYVARIGDDHSLCIEDDTRFLCIFEPALVGQEEAT
jgi:L-ectoine synthase